MTPPPGTGPGLGTGALPRREPGAGLESGGDKLTPETADHPAAADGHPGGADPGHPAVHAELIALRDRVPGVRGCVIAGLDGLLISHDLTADPAPDDLAVLAATTFGLGRQCGLTLQHGPFREMTVRSQKGYFSVYAVHDAALLAVLADDWLNLTRLHSEARPVADRLADLLHVGGTT